MQALVIIFFVLLIIEGVLVSIISYRKGQDKVREMYINSLEKLKQNYTQISNTIEDIAHDNNTVPKQVSNTESGRREL